MLAVNKQIHQSILNTLRQETHAVHERLHVHPLTSALISPDLTHDHYVLVLQAFERFHQIIEDQWKHQSKPYIPSKASIILRHDLTILGQKDNDLSQCPPLHLHSNQDSFLGMMYVIEGSNLGGQIIAKNIHNTLGYTHQYGASFFHGHGKDTAKHWKKILSLLNSQVVDVDSCAIAARITFESLEKWLWNVHESTVVTTTSFIKNCETISNPLTVKP